MEKQRNEKEALNKKTNIFYLVPLYLTIGWGIGSFLSIFVVNYQYIKNGFVLFSSFCKLAMSFFIFFLGKSFFFQKENKNISFYKIFKSFVGYGIVITYVFYSFPRIVFDFFENTNQSSYASFDFCIIFFLTLFPTILYLFLNSPQTKLVSGFYSITDIEQERKIKKDKVLRKKEVLRVRKERNFLQNLWYDWIDIILQAVLIVMLINQFLFQMYAIPSESMVPTFLKGDMVIVDKLIYGSQIPLTKWKLPSPFVPKTGDVVVYLNPETYNKNSDVYYKNIFARIFQPFLYRLTFTKIDLDKKNNGDPKERFIVKRMIAGQNEKICILNNEVYKKKKSGKWLKMSISAQEFGHVNLYYDENKGMDAQKITKEIRLILDDAQKLVSQKMIDESSLLESLHHEKQKFLFYMGTINLELFKKDVSDFLLKNRKTFEQIKTSTVIPFFINSEKKYYQLSDLEMKENDKKLKWGLEQYDFVAVYRILANVLYEFENSNFTNLDVIDYIRHSSEDSPYTTYMKLANAIYKKEVLTLLNTFFEARKVDFQLAEKENLHILKLLTIYLDGFEMVSHSDSLEYPEYYSFFELSQFPDYPNNTFLTEGEFFLMGDNRYNSLDCRFGTEKKEIYLDIDDEGLFSKKMNLTWNAHVIKKDFILGKARVTYFPFNRMRIIK